MTDTQLVTKIDEEIWLYINKCRNHGIELDVQGFSEYLQGLDGE